MKYQSNGKLFWKANLYLFQPNVAIYWLILVFLSVLVVTQHFNEAENHFLYTILLGIKGVFFLIFYYKIFDCMISILAHKEKSSFKPSHKFIFPISMRYCIAIFLITSIGFYVIPDSLSFIFLLFLFFITPAMIITVILNLSISEMLRPINWKAAINFVGKSNYFSLLYMPFLAGIILVTGGLFLLTTGIDDNISNRQLLFFTFLLQAVLTPYFIALQMVYCAFMMQQADVSKQESQFNQALNTDTLSSKKKINTLNIHVDLSQKRKFSYLFISDNFPLKKRDLKWLRKKIRENNGYLQVQPQIEKRVKEELNDLSPESIFTLIEIAVEYEDFSLVLLLGQNFKKRFAGRLNIVKVGFYVAQAMDKTGDREGSIMLLKSLIEEFNRFYPGMSRVIRAYNILMDKNV